MKTILAFLAVLTGASVAPRAAAQLLGTFSATGDMQSRRIFHTATLLTDGRVLIAGGAMIDPAAPPTRFKALSSAEIYDPSTGTFTPTGRMTMPRDGHTATLLSDGRVLITGGGATNNASGSLSDPTLASAELYNPVSGTFSATGDMTVARWSAKATLINNGKVLIAGGYEGAVFLASAELYDPFTGTFAATGNMTSWADTATVLPNGKVFITRGDPQGPGPYLSSGDLYDPSIGTFSSAGYLNVNHTAPTATLLMNGRVLVAGGDVGDGDGASVIAELYDPATGIFSSSGKMTAGREQDTATLLPDGTVLFVGGHNVLNLAASAEIYDPVQNVFSRTASMPTARELHTTTLLSDGRVLIAGGDDERYWIPETILSSAELYTPAALAPAPVLLSLSGDGKGQGAIWHSATGLIASSQNPAVPGEILSMYTTSLFEGGVIPPQVSIGGRATEVLFFGDAPGYPGYYQVNFRVPGSMALGLAVPVRLTYIGRPSNGVTIAVR